MVILLKKLVLIIIILVLIVAASGCTSDNTSSNKTYSANGITFVYPGSWSEQNSTTLQSQVGSIGKVVAVVGDGSKSMFGIAKVNIGSNERIASLNEWASSYNSTMKNQGVTYISEKTITVDGVDATMMTMKDPDSGTYITDVFFIKNGTAYLAVYASTNSDQQTFEQLLKNLHIT